MQQKAKKNYTAEEVNSMVAELLDPTEVIAFRPSLSRALGSVTAALFLSQAIYWQRVAAKQGHSDFYKIRDAERDEDGNLLPPSKPSMQSWEWELGMSRKEQESARKILVSKGLMSEKRKSTPSKLYFTVNFTKVAEFILINQQKAQNVPTSRYEACQQESPNVSNKLDLNVPTITESSTENISENIYMSEVPHVRNLENIIAEQACAAVIEAGIRPVDPNHAGFLGAVNDGATVDDFRKASVTAIAAGSPNFGYVVGIVRNQLAKKKTLNINPLDLKHGGNVNGFGDKNYGAGIGADGEIL